MLKQDQLCWDKRHSSSNFYLIVELWLVPITSFFIVFPKIFLVSLPNFEFILFFSILIFIFLCIHFTIVEKWAERMKCFELFCVTCLKTDAKLNYLCYTCFVLIVYCISSGMLWVTIRSFGKLKTVFSLVQIFKFFFSQVVLIHLTMTNVNLPNHFLLVVFLTLSKPYVFFSSSKTKQKTNTKINGAITKTTTIITTQIQ